MNLQQKKIVELFDRYTLTIPSRLKYHSDGIAGKRVLFITDSNESFVVSFEEGVQPVDMMADSCGGVSTVSFQCCKDGKYIHQRRTNVPLEGKSFFAFFHIEFEDDIGRTFYLPGQMTANADFNWSDGVEPVLLEIMEGISPITKVT